MVECPLCKNKFNREDGEEVGGTLICERCIAEIRCETTEVVKTTILSYLRGELDQYILQIEPNRVVDQSFRDGYGKCMLDILDSFEEDNVFICWRDQKMRR